MKQLMIFLLGIMSVIDVHAEAQMQDSIGGMDRLLTQEAVQYYSKLAEPLVEFQEANYRYIKAVTRIRKARKVEKKRQKLLEVIRANIEHFKDGDPFRGDTSLIAGMLRYLDLVYIVLKQDFDKILDMEDIKAQSYDQAEAHMLAIDKAVEKQQASYDVFLAAEEAFFNKYGITMNKEKSKLALKIEKANKALEYYNCIYRVFFRANKEAVYAREAAGRQDIAALEQHAMTLLSFSEEGLTRLGEMKGYNGDSGLLEAGREMLEHYKYESEIILPANVDFYIRADKFENAAKKFNATKERDRTKDVIAEYNRAVNKYNSSAKEINTMNQKSVKKHNKHIESWNKSVDKFFDKHS